MMHFWCTFDALLKVHQKCIKFDALSMKVHQKCIRFWKCIKSASKVHQKCIKSASWIHQIFIKIYHKNQKCIKSASKVHQKCINFSIQPSMKFDKIFKKKIIAIFQVQISPKPWATVTCKCIESRIWVLGHKSIVSRNWFVSFWFVFWSLSANTFKIFQFFFHATGKSYFRVIAWMNGTLKKRYWDERSWELWKFSAASTWVTIAEPLGFSTKPFGEPDCVS